MKFNIFNSSAPGRKYGRTTFDLTHDVKLTTDMGKLTPIFCEPVLPADTFRIRNEIYIRFAPMLAPIMQQIDCYVHYFFIPNRLLFKNWEKFITGGVDGTATIVYPRFKITPVFYGTLSTEDKEKYFGCGSLMDYLGFPPMVDINGKILDKIDNDVEFDSLPFLAFYLVWYRFYRDQNLDYGTNDEYNIVLPTEEEVEELVRGFDDGFIDPVEHRGIFNILFGLKYRAWEKDYFTSALPWAQRGPELMIPGITNAGGGSDGGELSIVADDDVDGIRMNLSGSNRGSDYKLELTDPLFYATGETAEEGKSEENVKRASNGMLGYEDGSQGRVVPLDNVKSGFSMSGYSDNSTIQNIADALKVVQSDVARMRADDADYGTINNLRRMFAIQRFTEAEARGGSRYPEWLQQIFGTNPGDYRLQQPTYLGGGKTKVVVSEVLQQSSTAATPDGAVSPLGDYAGRAVTAGSSRKIRRTFAEHGWIIGIMSVKPRSSYMQGLPRKFQKTDRFDFGNPYFAHLGEQEVKNSELFYMYNKDLNPAITNDGTFGYQSRFAEYKYAPNRTCGDFRGNLDFWHLTRKFPFLPGLDRAFIYMRPNDFNRIYAVQEEVVDDDGVVSTVPLDHLYVSVLIRCKAKRKLPRYGIPS